MNIIAVIVDEVPLSASRCRYADNTFDRLEHKEFVNCALFYGHQSMTTSAFVTERCPDCPLMTAQQYVERVNYEHQLQDDMQREDQMRDERRKLENREADRLRGAQ